MALIPTCCSYYALCRVPKPLKSLSIKEVDLTAGAEGKAKEILDQYPKAVLMLPFYHKDKHAGDIKPTEKQMAAKKKDN